VGRVLSVLADARRNFADVQTVVIAATQKEQVLNQTAAANHTFIYRHR
jgi:hypothetical protein